VSLFDLLSWSDFLLVSAALGLRVDQVLRGRERTAMANSGRAHPYEEPSYGVIRLEDF
jgi:hypothetical protein